MINDHKEGDSPFDDIKYDRVDSGHVPGMTGSLFSLKSEQLLQATGAIVQILLGMSTIILSLLGLIEPAWASTLMSIVGSFAFIIGAGLLLNAITRKQMFQSLLSEATRRVIESQN